MVHGALKPTSIIIVTYSSCALFYHRIHEGVETMFNNNLRFPHYILLRVFCFSDFHSRWNQRMPVISEIEFQRNSILVLEVITENDFGIVYKFETISTDVLYVIFNNNFYDRSYEKKQKMLNCVEEKR